MRVEADAVTQRLWQFDLDGANPRLVLAGVDSVGYHAWRDENTLALFIVGDPHSLRVASVSTGTETLVALDIGRALHHIPGSDDFSFLLHRDDRFRVTRLDPDTMRMSHIADALPGSQDCAWTPSGSLLMASESQVYVLSNAGDWEPVREFAEPALQGITRMAVSPDGEWLAIVSAEPEAAE